jgi:uncharacterized protein
MKSGMKSASNAILKQAHKNRFLPSPATVAQSFPVMRRATPLFEREIRLQEKTAMQITGEEGQFEGYASLFGVPDLARDIVTRGAFQQSLARRGARGIKLLWQHDPAQPLGRWISLQEDEYGLKVRGRLNLHIERARDIHALMKDGAVDGLSIGFRTLQARQDRIRKARMLENLDLWEISLVTFPMLEQARVRSVKRRDEASHQHQSVLS